MTQTSRFAAALVLSGLLTFCGCGGNESPPAAQPGGAEVDTASEGVKEVKINTLPALGDPMPPGQDQGRLFELAPPKNWDLASRDNAYVARFVVNRNSPNDLPRILVTAGEPTTFTDDVTPENVTDFSAAIAEELDKAKLLEQPKPMVIGPHAYVRYVTKAAKGGRRVERQVLETIFAGRRYAFALEVFEGDLVKNRDLAYSVAAHVKYERPADAESPAESPKEPAADSPAEPRAESPGESTSE